MAPKASTAGDATPYSQHSTATPSLPQITPIPTRGPVSNRRASKTMPAIQKRRDIKAGYDATDLRRRRADSSLSLRKQKKEQGLAKRRNTASSASAIASALQGSDAGDASAAESVLSAPSQRTFTPEDVPYLTAALKTSEGAARVEAVRGLRKVLSLEAEPPVSEVIQAGSLPLLVLCLDEHSDTELQVRALLAREDNLVCTVVFVLISIPTGRVLSYTAPVQISVHQLNTLNK